LRQLPPIRRTFWRNQTRVYFGDDLGYLAGFLQRVYATEFGVPV